MFFICIHEKKNGINIDGDSLVELVDRMFQQIFFKMKLKYLLFLALLCLKEGIALKKDLAYCKSKFSLIPSKIVGIQVVCFVKSNFTFTNFNPFSF